MYDTKGVAYPNKTKNIRTDTNDSIRPAPNSPPIRENQSTLHFTFNSTILIRSFLGYHIKEHGLHTHMIQFVCVCVFEKGEEKC